MATAGSSGKGSAAGLVVMVAVSKVVLVCVVTVVVSETVAGFWLVLGFEWLARAVVTVAARVGVVVALLVCSVVFGALAGFPGLVDTVVFATVWFRVAFLVSWPMARFPLIFARVAVGSVLFTVAFLASGPFAGFLMLLAGVAFGAVRFMVVFLASRVFVVVLAWTDVVAVVVGSVVVVVVVIVVTVPGLAQRLKPGAGKQLPRSTCVRRKQGLGS